MTANRTPKLLLDALQAVQAAEEFLHGVSLPAYQQDRMRRSAVERQLEILGEACARLSKLDARWLEWLPQAKLAIGLRNRIIHGYDAVDDELVYLTVREDLAPLSRQLQQHLDAWRP